LCFLLGAAAAISGALVVLLIPRSTCSAERDDPAGAIGATLTRFTTAMADYLGRPEVFITAVVIIIVWAVSGPFLDFSDTWQLIIKTVTTLVTFLVVFIIQNPQNRDSAALHLKLDILLREQGIAGPFFFGAENHGGAELEQRIDEITSHIEERPK